MHFFSKFPEIFPNPSFMLEGPLGYKNIFFFSKTARSKIFFWGYKNDQKKKIFLFGPPLQIEPYDPRATVGEKTEDTLGYVIPGVPAT